MHNHCAALRCLFFPTSTHANLAPNPCAGFALPCRGGACRVPPQTVAHTPCAILHSASSSLHRAFWRTCLEGPRLYRATSVGGVPPMQRLVGVVPPWAYVSGYPRAVARPIRHRARRERGVYNTKKNSHGGERRTVKLNGCRLPPALGLHSADGHSARGGGCRNDISATVPAQFRHILAAVR